MITHTIITEEEINSMIGSDILINESGELVFEGMKELAAKAKSIMKSKLSTPILAAITKAQIAGMGTVSTLDDMINKYAPALKTPAGKTALLAVIAGTAAALGKPQLASDIAKAGMGLAIGDSKDIKDLFLGAVDSAMAESRKNYNLVQNIKEQNTHKETHNMKLIIENFRQNMKKFKDPTSDPSFSDPGYNDPPDHDRHSDEAGEILGMAMKNPGTKQEVDSSLYVTYDASGDQFIADSPEGQEVFYADREEDLLDIMIDRLRNSQKEEEYQSEY